MHGFLEVHLVAIDRRMLLDPLCRITKGGGGLVLSTYMCPSPLSIGEAHEVF
jgi:hypothetical protein